MRRFRIIFSDSYSFISPESNLISTFFFVRMDDNSFPDSQWTDFAFPVLCWWSEAFLVNRYATESRYVLYFMDGPYRLEVCQKGEDLFMKGKCDRKTEETVFQAHCSKEDFKQQLLKAWNKLKHFLYHNPDCEVWAYCDGIKESVSHYIELLNQ